MGGGVQAATGYANHVVFIDPALCHKCNPKLCVEMCSGQALTRGDGEVPAFDREKCVYCGACLWNCRQTWTASMETSSSARDPVDCTRP